MYSVLCNLLRGCDLSYLASWLCVGGKLLVVFWFWEWRNEWNCSQDSSHFWSTQPTLRYWDSKERSYGEQKI